MKAERRLGVSAFALLGLLSISGCDGGGGSTSGNAGTSQELTIGRMKVSVMPEYDDPSVLVIYDGRFADASRYPIKTSFLIPKGSVISDACSLSHEGQHFCQLYKTANRGNYDEVSLILPYPNFYLSFHTPRLDTRVETKSIDYRVKANNAVRTLEVEIQQPLRSAAFKVVPPTGATTLQDNGSVSLIRGFNHVAYKLDGVAAHQEHGFLISYTKSDPNPSVDIKYTSNAMREPQGSTTSYESQRNIKTVIYVLFGTGVLGLFAILAWYLRSRKRVQGKQP
ncbi:MAG TPA: hypothetical protein VN444_06625 [Verrucomicrobiae bacterium]|nr:hypothetical protein [Verrucomicrobiae bacterium]